MILPQYVGGNSGLTPIPWRVVKVKMSKFKRKNKTHKSEERDLEKEPEIIWGFPGAAQSAEGVPLGNFVHGYCS